MFKMTFRFPDQASKRVRLDADKKLFTELIKTIQNTACFNWYQKRFTKAESVGCVLESSKDLFLSADYFWLTESDSLTRNKGDCL